MKTLKDLYKVGSGPSSSHTIGPSTAAQKFRIAYPEANSFKAILYDSLSKTGRGHRTDYAIEKACEPFPVEIIFDTETDVADLPHPNTLDFIGYKDGVELDRWRILSVGGGTIRILGMEEAELPDIYDLNSYNDIADYCRKKEIRIWQYVEEIEGPSIWDYLSDVWFMMKRAINEGLIATGSLPGGLELKRKANLLYNQRHIDESAETKQTRIVSSYAYAVMEHSADNGIVVTAPTCGSCGIVPALMRYFQETRGFSDEKILHALATGGIIGNLIKTNASISGAECGCQAEVGSACCMGAASLAELFEMNLEEIECAAEIAMEHHLGLSCDPIMGLVQIPCIERNAVAAVRAIQCVNLSSFLADTRKISFDAVIHTMYETGQDMPNRYKETSEGGLAKISSFCS